jgi:CheY-like chemotaxis protein
MKTFILEDSVERANWFRKNFGNYTSIICVTNCFEAYQRLNMETERFDMMFLDHDLAELPKILKKKLERNDGYEFCVWLAENHPEYKKTPIVIHSHNPCGAKRMMEYLTMARFTDVQSMSFSQIAREWERGTLCFHGHYRFDRPYH